MKPLETLLRNAARSQKTIVLSEGTDPRIVEAALEVRKRGIAKIILVGEELTVKLQFSLLKAEPDDGIEIHDPATSPHHDELAVLYYELRKHKGMTLEKALRAVTQPHVYAALLVKAGHADGTVGGAVATTAEIVRTAIQVIGVAPGASMVSSFFLMLFCESHHAKKGAYIFADSGLVVDPNAEEMAQIALASASSFEALTTEKARVAMLSFSTRGSASHAAVSKVVKATEIAKAAAPDLMIDGELQFDAAFVPDVAAAKASDSPLGGDANIFVFPNLESGNIAYKIAQRIGGAAAIGPVLQGLAKPANDLSRGCSAEDVMHMVAVTAAQAEALEE
ncbi:phosphate acetyltransferase [uncultured Shimia sp.]|uniref:phosphate acetyltransferase n=1 Tax=uncultured Shimia sp. TaxID=573152 RepID=UPI002623B57D|nr:phosphate acetyltransferase [uncultured Shimia sp.]